MDAPEALDPRRHHRAAELQSELGEGRGGHGVAAEERHGDPFVELLIDQHAEMFTLVQGLDEFLGAGGALGKIDPADRGAQGSQQGFHLGIVGGAVDLGQGHAVLNGAEGGDFPVAKMGREENAADPVIAQQLHILDADHLDPTVRVGDVDLAEMGVFGGDPTEIVPHAENNGLDLIRRFLRKGMAQVAPGDVADGQARADQAGQTAARSRGHVEGQHGKQGEQKPRPRRLECPHQGLHHRPTSSSRPSIADGSRQATSTRRASTMGRASTGRRTWSFSVVTATAPLALAASTRVMISSAL